MEEHIEYKTLSLYYNRIQFTADNEALLCILSKVGSSYQGVVTARHTDVASGQEGAGEPVTQRDQTHRLLEKKKNI